MGRGNHLIPRTALMLAILISIALTAGGCAGEPEPEPEEELLTGTITLATTTSTYDSGLLDFLNPLFTGQTGLAVEVISQGTGSALETGKRGDADVLLVHDRDSEQELVEASYFVDRHDVMYNDFIFVGPEEDPAVVKGTDKAPDALNLIAGTKSTFLSRGDYSGTHRMEMRLWEDAGLVPGRENWYLSIGQGMGDTLNMANEVRGYTMTDQATYAAMRDKLDLVVVLEGDPALINQYGIMAVSPELHSHVKYEYALRYIDFLISDQGQDLISSYRVNNETLFSPGYGLDRQPEP